jgi:hypothetical protein
MDAIKRAAAADIAMIQGNDRLPRAGAGGEREGEP